MGRTVIANEIKEKYIKEEMQDQVGVIGIFSNGSWWHIHDHEIVPDNVVIAIHIRDPHPEDNVEPDSKSRTPQ